MNGNGLEGKSCNEETGGVGGVKCESGKYETCQSDFATEEATWAEQEEKQSTWNFTDFCQDNMYVAEGKVNPERRSGGAKGRLKILCFLSSRALLSGCSI